MYKRILVPMEDEQQQEPALTHAQQLAQSTGASVLLAWLVPVLASEEQFFSQVQIEPGSSGAKRKKKGEAYLAQTVKLLQDRGVDVDSTVVVTPLAPEEAIVKLALEEEVDLIIMATLAQSSVGRFLFGSVEDKVRRRSPVPVLFVNPSPTGEKGV